jgi:competence transcription factor ComK
MAFAVKAKLQNRNECQWIIKLAGKDVKIREYGETLVKFANWSKDIVSSATTKSWIWLLTL